MLTYRMFKLLSELKHGPLTRRQQKSYSAMPTLRAVEIIMSFKGLIKMGENAHHQRTMSLTPKGMNVMEQFEKLEEMT